MEIKVMIPSPQSLDMFNYSNCSTPYISAPSSPQRPLNCFYSAPTSPRRFSSKSDPFSSDGIPFDWEYKPGVPKPPSTSSIVGSDQQDDFEFEFSGQLDMMVRPSISSADELFDGGKIRPLKPPPVLNNIITSSSMDNSPKSPRSPMSKFRDALSPRHRKTKTTSEDDPFEIAHQNTVNNNENRGRSKNVLNHRHNNNNTRKGISRSLSPLRVSEFALHQQQELFTQNPEQNTPSSVSSSSIWGSRKWRLKDFLLFRSASEGATTTGKNKNYFSLSSTKKGDDDNESIRSSNGSVSKRRGGQVSAHERHYMTNRAVFEEQKKKTSLPYRRHGLLACLGFNPALHDITKAFGSFSSQS